jgi:cytochrome c peroxidase
MNANSFASAAIFIGLAAVFGGVAATAVSTPALLSFPDPAGLVATYQIDGQPIRLTGPFFQPLSSNGRSCSTCHRPAQAWSISADEVQARFDATKGLDPIFRTNDGSNCDRNIDTKTLEGRRAAYSLLTGRGLIRMELRVPASAEFEVVSVRNPYGCDDRTALSTYRRPLPATNLRFLTSVMWDGREASPSNPAELEAGLTRQAANAATLHARAATPLNPQQSREIVRFELGLATAQVYDRQAGPLDASGARGGTTVLATETVPSFRIGINDPLAGDPHAIKAENAVRLFDAWSTLRYGKVYDPLAAPDKSVDAAVRRRASIARGQLIFNQQPFDIRGVAGLNDVRHSLSITGACGTCHNTPNAGNHSRPDSMDTGVADTATPLDVSYLPVMMLRNKTTGELKTTSDPGRALVTGRWQDVGKMKTPVLRGLAARAPYFHNGSAQTLADVVDFYNKRFHAGFSALQKEDLVAFLNSL